MGKIDNRLETDDSYCEEREGESKQESSRNIEDKITPLGPAIVQWVKAIVLV